LIFIGHTDNQDVKDPDRQRKNQKLPEERAEAVTAYLRSQNVSIEMQTLGKGMMRPKEAKGDGPWTLKEIDRLNGSTRQQAENRRVEILFIREGDKPPTPER
jgi:flagellar motor protein MotB